VSDKVPNQAPDAPEKTRKGPGDAGQRVEQFHNLSDIRQEQTSAYWLWRKYGKVKVSEMQMAVNALGTIGKTMEMERDQRIAELEAKAKEIEAALETRIKQLEDELAQREQELTRKEQELARREQEFRAPAAVVTEWQRAQQHGARAS
jgi:hypothetical protein